jgi:hypothetical protein
MEDGSLSLFSPRLHGSHPPIAHFACLGVGVIKGRGLRLLSPKSQTLSARAQSVDSVSTILSHK